MARYGLLTPGSGTESSSSSSSSECDQAQDGNWLDSDEEMADDPDQLSSRRRLQNPDIKHFFKYLDDRNISCGTLIRNLFDVDASRYCPEVRNLLQVHVKPFFHSQSAYAFVAASKGAKKVALGSVVDEIKREGKRAARMPEIRRPPSMDRAEDIRTYQFADAMDDIARTMPFTKAVINAIATSSDDEDETPSADLVAVAQALADLPRSSTPPPVEHNADIDSSATALDQMREAWEDVEELEGESNQNAEDARDDLSQQEPDQPKAVKGATVLRRGSRSPNIICTAATLSLLFSRHQRNSRFALTLSLFLFASRTPRRVIEVLSRLGMCVSYMTVLRIVNDLSRKAQKQARSALLDKTKIHVFGYDNINWQQKVNNVGTGHTTSMKAATHGTIYEVDPSTKLHEGPTHPVCHPQVFKDLFGEDMPHPTTTPTSLVAPEDPNLMFELRRKRDQMRKQALPAQLQPADIFVSEHIVLAILSHVRKEFLQRHSPIEFDPEKQPIPEPSQVWPQMLRKTKVIPLPVLDVDEGTTKGNLEVFKQYFRFQLQIPDSFWRKNVLFTSADVYSVEKLKTGQKGRQLDRSSQEFDRFSAQHPLAAPWHLMYAYMRCLFSTYGGSKENASFISFRHLSERNGFRHLLSIPHNFHDGNRFLHFWFSAASVSVVANALRKHRQPPEENDGQQDEPAPARRAGTQRPEEAVCPSTGLQECEHPKDEFDDLDYETFMRISEEAVRNMIGTGSSDMVDEHEHQDDFALQL